MADEIALSTRTLTCIDPGKGAHKRKAAFVTKAGKQFELVVADVVREMSPGAKVCQGEWIEGPDGRRELDVLIEGKVDGNNRRIYIECRDYNPKKRPIGIAQIDALDSKHRDLGMDASLLCSNAGFSDAAVRKAKRLGIGLIGVLREADTRIRYKVIDQIYIRRLTFEAEKSKIHVKWNDAAKYTAKTQQTTYNKTPIENWAIHRVLLFVSHNPIVRGLHYLRFLFKHPVELTFPGGQALAECIQLEIAISGTWVSQRLEIDASSGLYDWIRQTVRKGPGAVHIVFKDLKFGEGGNVIRCPPDFDRFDFRKVRPGETMVRFFEFHRFENPKDVPPLDGFVAPEDLDPVRTDLDRQSYFSW
jgi:hypothetical protein